MIPAEFDYTRPSTLTDAIHAIAVPEGATVLAGGQSLIPDLKARRKRARMIVDLGGVAELASLTEEPGSVRVGAMVRQTDLVAQVGTRIPLLAEVAHAAADPMVRRRGTLVGACCEAAPGGDWVAAALALDGEIVAEGPAGRRDIPLTSFVTGPGTNALTPDEIATSIRLRVPSPGTVSAYRKVKHVAVGWSVGSVALVLGEREDDFRVAVSGATRHPQRLTALEAELRTIDRDNPAELMEVVDDSLADLEYQGDYYASAPFRRQRLAVLIKRTLAELS